MTISDNYLKEEDRKFFNDWIDYKPEKKEDKSRVIKVCDLSFLKLKFDLLCEDDKKEFKKWLKGNDKKALFTSNKEEWWSPSKVMSLVYRFFGHEGIDIDPCSNSSDPSEANISARTHFSKADDGLSLEWNGTVYMNPPYGREVSKWVNKAISEFDKYGKDIVMLLPNRSETKWFKPLKRHMQCLIDGRLTFIDGETNEDAEANAPFPSVVVILTNSDDSRADFREIFSEIGDILSP